METKGSNQEEDKNPSAGEQLLPEQGRELRHDEQDNLGLDADRSSDNQTLSRRYNIDNDVISHNPDGEDDNRDSTETRGSSPLMDK
ncbi:hypothetical protein ACTHQF_16905 [Pedobacter sp. SAFR-022]|uniref:hypothetical protein n=1 Tax=Pedobacter sp. SAFR-022 TaxID=3436861 RepID=UPI003F7EFD9F